MAGIETDLPEYDEIVERLTEESEGVHDPATVEQCVTASANAARDVTGAATPDLVERVARKHLEVLALVAAER